MNALEGLILGIFGSNVFQQPGNDKTRHEQDSRPDHQSDLQRTRFTEQCGRRHDCDYRSNEHNCKCSVKSNLHWFSFKWNRSGLSTNHSGVQRVNRLAYSAVAKAGTRPGGAHLFSSRLFIRRLPTNPQSLPSASFTYRKHVIIPTVRTDTEASHDVRYLPYLIANVPATIELILLAPVPISIGIGVDLYPDSKVMS